MEQQNRQPYPLPPPNPSIAGQGQQQDGMSHEQMSSGPHGPHAGTHADHITGDRLEEQRKGHMENPPASLNSSFFPQSLPSLASFTQQPTTQSPALGPGHMQSQTQGQSGYQSNHGGLPSLSQAVPRRDIDTVGSRRDGPGHGPPTFQHPGHRADHMTQEATLQDQAAKSEVVQAAQRAAEAGYRPLNVKDALSYLDQVKIQFYDQPDVYNKFLDIMKDFKSQSIDTPGVIERVSTLFRGHPSLVQGFNTFLPPGYRIECSLDPSDPNPIRVTTPQGTVNQVNGRSGGPTQFSAPVPHATSSSWRNEDQFATNAAYGMTMVSQAASQQHMNGTPGANGEKKPVEFNHAINYVNKIKTRFSNEPDTYKHFLEILQTYQKDAKPIQEVYSQVTELFKGAQDLLQDFKQFLPENNASTSAAARLPTVGTFAPPTQSAPSSSGRERKRRPAENPRPSSKKTKSTHRTTELGPASPNLIPAAPEPLTQPSVKSTTNYEELAFFDRAKKHINNKASTTEFFKVLNLFTQEIIDKNTLVEKIDGFLGGNRDLMDQFKKIVRYTGADEVFENLPATTRPKIDLSLCKAFGPSYRQLPKSETLLPCSGRDDMCWEVLNDIYVSHPTWASEDAGFVTHKKNQYEEALHKIEEERYEYDLNIEANLRTIQLLEPIAQRISSMTDEEKRQFRLPPGLGGQSIAIYQKVIKKIYDKQRGQEVIDQLHENPVVAVPVVLKRLKQKDEEWKRAQREWNKVWRETEVKNYYKSLDHQGTFFKAADKKVITARNMIAEIDTLRRIQEESRINPRTPKPRFQYEFSFERHDICLDIQRLIDSQISRFSVSAAEKEKMTQFNHNFIPFFFGITRETLVASAGGDAEDLAAIRAFSSGVSTRRKKAGEEIDLLKSIMKRTRESAHNKKKARNGLATDEEVESTVPSRASTPAIEEKMSDADSGTADDSVAEMPEAEELPTVTDRETDIWTDVNHNPNAKVSGDITQPSANQPSTSEHRHIYNLFSNSTFYCFLRWFQMLYSRLHNLKLLEREVTSELRSRKPNKTAVELGLVASRLASMAIETEDDTDHYEQLLVLCDNLIQQTLDSPGFEDMLRHIYGTKAFRISTVDKITLLMAKQIHTIVTEEKNISQLAAFYKDRNKPTTTPREQIIYRIQTETTIGTNEQVYRSEWDDQTCVLRIQLIGKDDVAHAEAATKEEAWRYYLDSWTIAKPTFGVAQEKCKPCLLRNLPRDGENDVESYQGERFIKSQLQLKVCMSTYKLFFVKGTEDVLVRRIPQNWGPLAAGRKQKFESWLETQIEESSQDVFDTKEAKDIEMVEA